MDQINQMRCAVTGASGFVGKFLIRRLLDQGKEVSVLVRNTSDLDTIFNDTRVVEGDLSDRDVLRDLVVGCDVVFHLASYVHKPTITDSQKIDCYQANFQGTKNLVDVCLELNPVPFFLYFSTVSVYGKSRREMEESQECNPTTTYGESKLASERFLMTKINAGLIEGCILRPCSIIGENAPGNVNRMIKIIDRGILPIFDKGLNQKSLIYVDDVVFGALLCVEMRKVSNAQIYNLADNHPLPMIEIGYIISKALGKKPLIIKLPKKTFNFFTSIWDRFASVFNGKLPLLNKSLDVYCSEDTVNTNKIIQELGFNTNISIEEGLYRMVETYKYTS